ncbi:MAG: LamG domain-containing protein [Candidatus Thermoplasmatota archaeon]|nr:LamG domain-containing protein [Candidatus Thermoplasmatota archaeon]
MKKKLFEKLCIVGLLLMIAGTSMVPTIATPIKTQQDIEPNEPLTYDDDLIAYWNFDEGSGTIAHDLIGGYDGTIHGATWTDGIYGAGVYFDGDDDYIQCQSPVLNNPPYTVCAWANASELPGSVTAYLLSNGGQTRESYGFYFSIEYRDNWEFGAANNGASMLQVSDSPASTGDWVFLVGTWDGSQTPGSVQLYVNGLPIGTYDSGAWYTGPSEDLRMGAPSNKLAYFFNGILDEVRIYNRVLSQEEIITLYTLLDFTITSGFGIHLEMKNNGTFDVSDIDWQIIVQGGLLGYINIVKSGSIATIAPNDTVRVSSGLFLGFGDIRIQVKIEGYTKVLYGKHYLIYTQINS